MNTEIQRYRGSTEIAPAEQATALASGQPPGPDDLMEVIEKRNQLVERLLNYAISATHPGQWQMLGDKPWPTGPACEAMARRCGVSWDRPESEKADTSDELGPAYTWTYRARFFLPSGIDSIWAEGHCSSRDQFLGTGTKVDDHGEYETRALPEVEEGNIRQAAMTNMVVNGVTRLLGVRNLTRERLDQLLGQGASEAMGKVAYNAGAKGGGRGQSSEDVEIKFGKGKGKQLSELGDEDVRWYVAAWEKDLADPEKEKFHKYSRKNIEIAQRLLAARANSAAGVSSSSAAAQPSIWQRVHALPEARGVAEESLKEIVKTATDKANAKDLTEEDLPKIQAALKKGDSDIRF